MEMDPNAVDPTTEGRMVPLSAVAPLLAWAASEIVGHYSYINTPLQAAYDHAAEGIGLVRSLDLATVPHHKGHGGHAFKVASVTALRWKPV